MLIKYGPCTLDLPAGIPHEDGYWVISAYRNTQPAGFDIAGDAAPAAALHTLWQQSSVGSVVFAINKKQDYAILTNQYLGTTPLYWKDNAFRASPPDTTRLSDAALMSYLHYGHVPTPLSMFAGWQRLGPGSAALILRNDSTWEPLHPELSSLPRTPPQDDAVYDVLRSCLRTYGEAGQKTILAFSGGVDSSLLAALATDVNPLPLLLTIEAEGGSTEQKEREQAARILNQKEEIASVTQADAFRALEALSAVFPEPFGHPISLKYWLLCQAAHARGGRTLITGDGADEIWSINHENSHKGDKFSPIFLYPFHDYPSWRWPRYTRVLDATDCGIWNVDVNLFGCGNLMSLHESACANGLRISLPFVEYESALLARRLLADRPQMAKKAKLKRLARRFFPSSMVDAPKRGFRSDAELWFRDGLFRERLVGWFERWPTWLKDDTRRHCQALLEEHQTLPGKGHSWPLYLTLALLEWTGHNKMAGISN